MLKENFKLTPEIQKRFTDRIAIATLENELESMSFEACGILPRILSPESKPVIIFRPQTKDEFISIMTNIPTSGIDAVVRCAGKDDIKTYSPYLICVDTEQHGTINEAKIKFASTLGACPVWVHFPKDMISEKFFAKRLINRYVPFSRVEFGVVYYATGTATFFAVTEDDREKFSRFIVHNF